MGLRVTLSIHAIWIGPTFNYTLFHTRWMARSCLFPHDRYATCPTYPFTGLYAWIHRVVYYATHVRNRLLTPPAWFIPITFDMAFYGRIQRTSFYS